MTVDTYARESRVRLVEYGFHDTPLGECLVAVAEDRICNLHLPGAGRRAKAAQVVAGWWPYSRIERNHCRTSKSAAQICHWLTSGGSAQLSILLKGSPFQLKVWNALLRIPYSEVRTYKDVANMIRKPSAVRAVANAIGKNPIGLLVPCHRVIRSTGELGGYRWGLKNKQALLDWESRH